jgi:hypothetical protein
MCITCIHGPEYQFKAASIHGRVVFAELLRHLVEIFGGSSRPECMFKDRIAQPTNKPTA